MNRFYYQDDVKRVSTCPLTIHALLHIADSIKSMGPVWCYWAFPMERYCGRLKPAIRSRRCPYSSLNRYVLEDAQLTQIKAFYNLAEELSLRPPRDLSKVLKGTFVDKETCEYPPFTLCRIDLRIYSRSNLYPSSTTDPSLESFGRHHEEHSSSTGNAFS